MKLTSLLLASALTLGLTLPLLAEEGGACVHACQPGKFEMTHATGAMYCVNCALKAETGANVDCATTGHKMALKTTKVVDYCGDEKPAKVGMTLFFLDNEASKPLMAAAPGTQYTVSGRLFENVPMMEVEEISLVASEVNARDDCCPEGEKKVEADEDCEGCDEKGS